MKKARVPMILLIVATLIIASPAMADIQRSEQYVTILEARQAIIDQYGFTIETMGLFTPSALQEQGISTFTFYPIKYAVEFGEYTVSLQEGEAPDVSWKHDGADPKTWASGELDDPVWGLVQAKKYLDVEMAYEKRMSEVLKENDGKPWSMENQIEVDQILVEAKLGGVVRYGVGVSPTESDLTQEEAIERAREAVIQKYGIAAEKLAQYKPYVNFFVIEGPDAKASYSVTLDTQIGEWVPELGVFYVTLRSPSGEIEECYWSVGAEYRTLPEGPLDNYSEAVDEFVQTKALYAMPHAEKADTAERITATGYKLYNQFAAPKETDLPEAEAITAAKAVLLDKYGLTDEMLVLFDIEPSFQIINEQPSWVIGFAPVSLMPYPFMERLGKYYVTLEGVTGEMIQVDWTLMQTAQDTKGYTKDNWGEALTWDASVIPWVVELYNEHTKAEEICVETDWSMESLAARDQLFRDAGFGSTDYSIGLPGAEDMTLEQAKEIAMDVLTQDFGMDKDYLANCRVVTYFIVSDPEQPLWQVSVMVNNSGSGYISINARTGEVINAWCNLVGNG